MKNIINENSMQRFYFDMDMKERVSIDDKEFFHQISHVLRSKLGDLVNLFNGDGNEYIYSIADISKRGIMLDLISSSRNETDPDLEISLFQAIPNRFEKIDYIIQKGVEVGINEFIFFRSERSSKLVISENKNSRYMNIIKESLEQCGGNRFPGIRFADGLDIGGIRGKTIVCDTRGDKKDGLRSLQDEKKVNILIGPEGGFSDNELKAFRDHGFESINFGKRILRTETVSSVLSFGLLNLNP